MSEESGTVTPEAPWLGLRPFTEETSAYFFGRDAELDDLYERVLHRPLTIFFGQSGLGKTSLLRAGLVPRLRETGFLPIMLRLGWGDSDPEPEAQVLAELRAALRSLPETRWQRLAEFPTDLSLWRLLHDPAHGFLPGAATLTPPRLVFLFDQFEEIFTLGQRQAARVEAWRHILAALVENRPPATLRTQLQDEPGLIDRLDLKTCPAKFLFTLRHDFLHLLERWRRNMPSLFDNRFELKLLNGRQALHAVLYPGRLRANRPAIIADDTGAAIVRFVAGAPPEKPLTEIDAVPPLLSLICAELNNERLALRAERIVFDPFFGEPRAVRDFLESLPMNADGQREPVLRIVAERELTTRGLKQEEVRQSLTNLASKGLLWFVGEAEGEYIQLSAELIKFAGRSGKDILQAFYSSCFTGLEGGTRAWLEEHFLSPEGFRQSINYDTALASLKDLKFTEEETVRTLETLVVNRLLTGDEHGEVRRLEITHDILAPIVRESRDRRRQIEAKERIESEAAQALKRTRRRQIEAKERIESEAAQALKRTPVQPTQSFAKVDVAADLSLLDANDWNYLLVLAEGGRLVPVVGPQLVTFGEDDEPLYPLLARGLLESHSLGPELEITGAFTFDDIALALARRGTDYRRLSLELHGLMRSQNFAPGSMLRMLAAVEHFRLFLTTTIDPLLPLAVDQARHGGSNLTQIWSFSLKDRRDLFREHNDRGPTSCCYLLGRIGVLPDCALTLEDVAEYCLALLESRDEFGKLRSLLKDKTFLFLGVDLSVQPYWLIPWVLDEYSGLRNEARSDHLNLGRFQRILPAFSGLGHVAIVGKDRYWKIIPVAPREFVSEFHARWHQRNPMTEAGPYSPTDTMPPGSIFISYAREDSEAVARIARSLNDVGLNVWFDRAALKTGDSLIQQVRRNIRDCTLFLPIISRRTEANAEGFFRFERRLAAERIETMSHDMPFCVPLVIDGVDFPFLSEPDVFRQIQYVRAPDGNLPEHLLHEMVSLYRRAQKRRREAE